MFQSKTLRRRYRTVRGMFLISRREIRVLAAVGDSRRANTQRELSRKYAAEIALLRKAATR